MHEYLPIPMPDLKAYHSLVPAVQEGSIVSKKLSVTESERIIAFAFARGQELTSHTSPMAVVLTVVDGTAEVSVDGVSRSLGAEEQIDLPPNVPHSVKAVDDMRMLLRMTRVDPE